MVLLTLSPALNELSETFAQITFGIGAVWFVMGAFNAFGRSEALYLAAILSAAWVGLWGVLLIFSLPAKTPGPPEDYLIVIHAVFAAPGLLVLLIAGYGISFSRLARQREEELSKQAPREN